MRLSDTIEQFIKDMISEEPQAEVDLKRNELAAYFHCAPSQINYVLSTRFTPDHGYVTSSQRGGGGYIRITRIKTEKSTAIMNIINSIGSKLDALSAEMIIKSLIQRGIISENTSKLMLSAVSDRVYTDIPVNLRCILRASILKNMLLTQM